ncbi:DUF4040 family protein [Millisia brevis]|uniref:DUF4040 family protein n=1 Tax=Millisia brevis TaxID=264148 RepID=UPI000A887206|nr:DUF4040 family protein [Millisia brevis]
MLISVALALSAVIGVAPAVRFLGRNAGWLLAVPLFAAAAVLVAITARSAGEPIEQSLPWIPTVDISFALRLDGLAFVFAMLVLVIGGLVLAYSARYLGRDDRSGSFYPGMTAFAAAMLLLVLADDLVLLFVAWEATTLCSFFLIAQPGSRARKPAVRTLLVTAAGGLVLLGAVATIVVGTGTTRLSTALADPVWQDNPGFTTAVAVMIAIAAFTKSAQFPFQFWLPDSMVAISPVSAYLHAAAMVKAGIYLMLRFSPVLAGEPVWTALLVTCGLVTALLGAASALRRFDLKGLLAYSTMSQLGLLTVMIGVGTPAALTAALVHTIAHALFKAALFMLVGIIDHRAHTRDIRQLSAMSVRMPITAGATIVAGASMAGLPPLLGFVSKESMFEAFLHAPGAWVPIVVVGAALTSILTFAYTGRLLFGAFGGRGTIVPEVGIATRVVPMIAAFLGLALGLAPFLLDASVSAASTVVAGQEQHSHLALWHGFNPALGISAFVIAAGAVLVWQRSWVDRLVLPLRSPVSGIGIVERLRGGIIRFGVLVGAPTASDAPRRHLAIPMALLAAIAVIGVLRVDAGIPPVAGELDRPTDVIPAILVVVGVLAAVLARTRVAAILVVGVAGFAMTLWFISLGAVDVALTQLLVEILTLCVMVLLLPRLPRTFGRSEIDGAAGARARRRKRVSIGVAVASGIAASMGVWALTGRREASNAAQFYLGEAETTTGGANIVNTILVDFRALDTLGELTVLGIAGVAAAALLDSRRLAPRRTSPVDPGSPLADPRANSVFVRTVGRLLGPIIVAVSVVLLWRGHQEPGGGFIAALVGGSGVALLYLAAPSDDEARIRWPHMALIGAGILIGTGTGLLGYLEGSFLTPLHADILGYSFSTALVFDIGVYLAVIGVVLASFNLLGRERVPSDKGAQSNSESVIIGVEDRGVR